MAMTVAELEAVLRLRDEVTPALRSIAGSLVAFEKSLNSVTKTASETGEAVGRAGRDIQQMGIGSMAVAVALGGVFQNATNRLIAFAKEGMDTAIRLETLTKVSYFVTQAMKLTTGEVDALAASLNKQGISMTQSRDAIVQFARANLDLSKASELATVAQSAARLSGSNSSDTLQRLIFGIQTLQPEVLRTAGVIVSVEGATRKWAEQNKVAVSSMSGAQRQAALMNAVLEEGQRISGVYATTNETVGGKIQSLTRHFQDAGAVMFTQFIPYVRMAVDALTTFLKAVKESPQEFFALGAAIAFVGTALNVSWLVPVALAAVALDLLISGFTGTLDPMTNFYVLMEAIGVILTEVATIIKALTGGYVDFNAAVAHSSEIGSALKLVWLSLKNIAADAAIVINAFAEAILSVAIASARVASIAMFGDQKKQAEEGIKTLEGWKAEVHTNIGTLQDFQAGLADEANALVVSSGEQKKATAAKKDDAGVMDSIKAKMAAYTKELEKKAAAEKKASDSIRIGKAAEKMSLDMLGKASADGAATLEAALVKSGGAAKLSAAAIQKHGDEAVRMLQSGQKLGPQTQELANRYLALAAAAADAAQAEAMLNLQMEVNAQNTAKVQSAMESFGFASGKDSEVAKLQKDLETMMQAAGGDMAAIGDDAILTYLAKMREAVVGASPAFIEVGNQIQDAMFSGLSDKGQFRAMMDELTANMDSLPASFAEGGKAAEELIQALYGVSPEMAKMVAETIRQRAEMSGVVSKTFDWKNALQAAVGVAAMFGGKVGEIAQVMANIGDSWDRISKMEKGKEKTKATIGMAAQAVGAIGGVVGGQAGASMQGAASGAQLGLAVAGPWGAAVGAVVGGVLGWLKGGKVKKAAKEAGKALGTDISDELAKKIMDTAKEMKISIKVASLLNLSDAMAESKKAASTFAPQVASLMKGIADGSIPAKEGLEQVGQAFTKIADEAMKAGTVGSREMVALIKQARAMKIDSPEIKAFVGEQLNLALAGVKKFVSAIKVLDEEWVKWLKDSRGDALGVEGMKKAEDGIKSLGKTAGVVFGAMFSALAEENGIVSAVDAMSEDFASLKESLSASLGPEMANQILGPFAAAFDTIGNEHLRPLFEGIDGLSQAMKGLANAGYLNVEQFAAMQAGIGTMFDLSIAGGADMKTSLLAVSPAIQAAISAAQEFGIPLDADTQRLKTLAEQNGITFKTDPMRAMLDVLVEIAKVMGADIPDSVTKMRASVDGGTAATTTAAEEAAAAATTAKEAFDTGMKDSMGDNTKEGWIAKFGEAVQAGREAVTEFTTMQQAAAFAALQTAQTVGAGVSAAAGASILSMAQAAEAGSAQAAAALQASLQSGALSVGDLANDPAWAALVTQLSSDVPEAARAAAAAIAAIIANVPGAINIPVNVTNGGPPPEPPPEVPPEGFAGGTKGWRSFSSKGTPVVLHNTEAVIRPGDPVLPGQVGGNTTTVNLSINENPMQTAASVEQMRRFTLRAAERELSKNLSNLIESGRA